MGAHVVISIVIAETFAVAKLVWRVVLGVSVPVGLSGSRSPLDGRPSAAG